MRTFQYFIAVFLLAFLVGMTSACDLISGTRGDIKELFDVTPRFASRFEYFNIELLLSLGALDQVATKGIIDKLKRIEQEQGIVREQIRSLAVVKLSPVEGLFGSDLTPEVNLVTLKGVTEFLTLANSQEDLDAVTDVHEGRRKSLAETDSFEEAIDVATENLDDVFSINFDTRCQDQFLLQGCDAAVISGGNWSEESVQGALIFVFRDDNFASDAFSEVEDGFREEESDNFKVISITLEGKFINLRFESPPESFATE